MKKTAYSIEDFCEAHDFCRASLYNLWKRGQGPRFMRVGTRRIITIEAAAEWRRAMEAATEAD